jgi:ectoine hydroxylase-related dioxygenase (phytanoyl-CoA dioxygenase family)
MKPFRELRASDAKFSRLKDEIDSHGYVLIRELLPPSDLKQLLEEIAKIIHAEGWTLPGSVPLERIAAPAAICSDFDIPQKRVKERVFKLESFHGLAHHSALREAMHLLVGPQLLIHPKPVGRFIFPNCERLVTRPHQDNTGIGGDTESFTAWMPLHDCPPELGPLQILEASHRYGHQSTPDVGWIAKEQAQGGDWVGGTINAGDVLIFHSLTVHAASLNTSDQLRISLDCRFQDVARPIDPANLVFPGGGTSWDTTYAGWRSDELKYYWKRIPLRFSPSRSELEHLAQSTDSERMRTRYATILRLLDEQLPDWS